MLVLALLICIRARRQERAPEEDRRIGVEPRANSNEING